MKIFVFSSLLIVNFHHIYSSNNFDDIENIPPSNIQPAKRKQRGEETSTSKQKQLKKAAIGTKDIRGFLKPKLQEDSAEIPLTLPDTSTDSNFFSNHLHTASLVTYEDGYLAKLIINNPVYAFFKNHQSAEAWILLSLKNLGFSSPVTVKTEMISDDLLAEFNQEKNRIMTQNPFLLIDESIAKFKCDISQKSEIKQLEDSRYLAKFLVNPEINHNIFKYFADYKSAETWIESQHQYFKQHPIQTQQEKKLKRKQRLMQRL